MSYRSERDKLIREKGFDADDGMVPLMLVIGLFIFGGAVIANGSGAGVLICVAGAALLVLITALRARRIGVGQAIRITLNQTLTMATSAFIWFVKMIWSMFNKQQSDWAMGGSVGKVSDKERKAALKREYEAKVAAIQAGGDEVSYLTGETAAEVEEAAKDYEHEVEMMGHEYKG